MSTATRPRLERATYTAQEVADLFGISDDQVREQVKRGEFPVQPIPGLGRRVLFVKARVDAYLGIPADQTP
jgi:excisionase family DNA binding protein